MLSADAPAIAARKALWKNVRKVLVVRLDNLGDVLMSTPAIQAIKQGAPHAQITLLASRAGVNTARHVPAIDDVLAYDAPWVKNPTGGPSDNRVLSTLRRGAFDAAVIFTVCTQSALPAALMCRMAGIPLRLAHSRENPYDLLTDWVPDHDVCEDGMRHEVRRQLDLVGSVGFQTDDERLVFHSTAGDVIGMRRKFHEAGGDLTRPFIVVHPGATAASRRYPAERFGAAAAAVARRTDCQVVFTGGNDEHELVGRALEHTAGAGFSLAGRLTLGELAALIAEARVTVCNNSGPAHVSAAVGTPVVVLYALTNPQHTPWNVESRVLNHDVPCRNCLKSTCPQVHHACLLEVSVDEVAHAALELMRRPAVRQRASLVTQPVSLRTSVAG